MAGRMRKVGRALALLAVAGAMSSASAQSADPTQPPAGYAQDSDSLAAGPVGPVLESVVIPKKGKPLAVISGRQVRIGELYGESRLIRVSEREAVLDGPAGIERLALTPGIQKINIVTKNRTQAPTGAQSGSKQ